MASSEYAECLAYLKQGAALDVAVFMSWFGARKEGEWLQEKDEDEKPSVTSKGGGKITLLEGMKEKMQGVAIYV